MSSASDLKSLRAACKSGAFASVYYFHGDDDYVKEEEVRRVIEAAVDPATRDFNFETLRGADQTAESLGSLLGTPPMMADRRVIVLRDPGALKKDARAALDRYLKNPASDVLLLLVSPSGSKADKALLNATDSIEFAPLTGERIPRWITYYVEHDLGTSITEGAVKLLQEAAGTELAQLRIELDKLVSYTGGAHINGASVEAVVGVRPGETMGDFLDAVAARDAAKAVAMIPTILQQPKSNAVTTIMALTAQTLIVGWAQAAIERGTPASRLSREVFDVMKQSGSLFTGRAWGEFASTCIRAAEVWSARAVDEALARLLKADAALKDTRLSSDEQFLANLVLGVCGVSPRRRAA